LQRKNEFRWKTRRKEEIKKQIQNFKRKKQFQKKKKSEISVEERKREEEIKETYSQFQEEETDLEEEEKKIIICFEWEFTAERLFIYFFNSHFLF
jgi:hypothetical protein